MEANRTVNGAGAGEEEHVILPFLRLGTTGKAESKDDS